MVEPRVRLVVLYGGQSAEHDVSCISAFNVVQAVDPDRYDVRLVGITSRGRWVDATPALAALPAGARALPSPDGLAGADAARLERTEATTEEVVVLPLLHGPMGEDGTVQGMLEVSGVAYVGAGVAGSAAAMDKGLAKALLGAAGLPQARYLVARDVDVDDLFAKRVEADLGWPVFVKPANMGSSIGVSKVKAAAELGPAIERALRYDEFVVVEEAVVGREIEVAVLGWPVLRASVPGEIRPSHEFYDYDDKYVDGTSELIIPADLPADMAARLGTLAVEACQALRVDGMARVDFFLEEGRRGPLINEVNTIPGFTPISMYPMLWAATGVGYAALIDELIQLARRRRARRTRFETHRA